MMTGLDLDLVQKELTPLLDCLLPLTVASSSTSMAEASSTGSLSVLLVVPLGPATAALVDVPAAALELPLSLSRVAARRAIVVAVIPEA